METHKNIINYEKLYTISNLGNIYSLNYKRTNIRQLIKLKKNTNNYLFVTLYNNKIRNNYLLHRLIAIHFISNPNNYNIVNHIDGNILNNNLENLEWVNNRENISHYKLSKIKSSKYIGVYLHKPTNKWLSRIQINNKNTHLGYFNTEEEAHEAYKNALKQNNIINKYNN